MRVLFIRGGGHEGIRVFQEEFVFLSGSLFRLKKKKASDFSKCEIISLLFNTGKKNYSKPCEHLFNAFVQITSYARSADLSIGSTSHFLYCPLSFKDVFNCNVIQKQDLGVFFFLNKIFSVGVSLSPSQWKSIRVFTE